MRELLSVVYRKCVLEILISERFFMQEKLQKLISAYRELEQKLSDPDVVSNQKEYIRLSKEHANQAEIVAEATRYLSTLDDIAAAKELAFEESDPTEKKALLEVVDELEAGIPELEETIKILLLPEIQTTIRTRLLRFEQVSAEMRQVFLRVTSLRCISVLLSRIVGRLRSLMFHRQKLAVTKK